MPFALLADAIFGGSRLLVVGPDAALSVLAAPTIASVATGDDDYLEVTSEVARVVVLGVTAVSSIDSTGFSALVTLRDDLESRGIEFWSINPTSRKTALLDEEADVPGITVPLGFEDPDDVLAAYEQLHTDDGEGAADADQPV